MYSVSLANWEKMLFKKSIVAAEGCLKDLRNETQKLHI